MNEKIIFDTVLGVALTGGLVEALKRAVGISKRFIPLLSVGIGIGLSIVGLGVTLSNVLFGLVVGLTSCGLYSGTKASLGK